MRTTKRKISWLAYGLCLAISLYNCKTKTVDPPAPDVYDNSALDNLKLPDITVTTPAAVTVTSATITSSTLTATVWSGLATIASTGQVPAVVKEAASNVGKVVSNDQATAFIASFTPDVINGLTSKGETPAALKANVAAMAANPALVAYMPTYTLPMVNGKPVSGRIGATVKAVATALSPASVNDLDACLKAANDAYNNAVARLSASKTTQTAAVNAAYTQNETAANAEVPGCQSGVPAKYAALIASAKTDFDAIKASLDASKATLGDEQYNQLLVMAYVTFGDIVGVYNTLMAAETNACTLVKDAKIAAAKIARDSDLNTINTNYNTAAATATTARAAAITSCHNQGNGG